MGAGNSVTIVVDADNRAGAGLAATAKSVKTVGDAAQVADKQLRDMGARLDAAEVKARKMAEAEERAADKTRQLAMRADALRQRISETGDETGKLSAKLAILERDTRHAANATDDYRRAADRASENAREQARAYDKVANNAREAARAVATLGASALLSPNGKSGGGGSFLGSLLGIGSKGAQGGLAGIGAGISTIGSIGTAAGPYGTLAGITAGAAAAPIVGTVGGATAGGAALAAGGAAAAGLGLAGAWASDPEKYAGAWAASTDKIKKRWLDSSKAFSNELDTGLKIADRTLQALPVEKVLALSQSFVTPLAQGAGSGITAFADGFADALEKVQPVIDVLGPALGNLGHAGGDAMRAISIGSEGGALALKDMADAAGFLIRATGIMILGFEDAYAAIRNFEKANFEFIGKVPGLRRVLGDMKDQWDIHETLIVSARALDKTGEASTNAGSRLAGLATDAARAAIETMGLNDALNATRETMFAMADANFAVAQGWLDLEKGLKDGERTLNSNKQAGLDNIAVIQDQVKALETQRRQAITTAGDNVTAIDAANAAYASQMERIYQTAEALGFSRDEVNKLITAMGGIPPEVKTNVEQPGMPAALSNTSSLGARLNMIDKTYIARIQVTGLAEALAAAARASAALANIGPGKGNAGGAGLASGGIGGAAMAGLTRVGEEGPEYARLPQGMMMYPASNTRQMDTMAGWGSSGGTATVIFGSDGSRLGDAALELVAAAVKSRGGRPELLGLKIQGSR